MSVENLTDKNVEITLRSSGREHMVQRQEIEAAVCLGLRGNQLASSAIRVAKASEASPAHVAAILRDVPGGGVLMHQQIYERLKQAAKAGQLVTYGEIASLAGLDMARPSDRAEIGRILGEISTHEFEQGRPLLSAIVVLKDKRLPGEGFFTIARELNLYQGNDDERVARIPYQRGEPGLSRVGVLTVRPGSPRPARDRAEQEEPCTLDRCGTLRHASG